VAGTGRGGGRGQVGEKGANEAKQVRKEGGKEGREVPSLYIDATGF